MVRRMALVRDDGYVANVIMHDPLGSYEPPVGLSMLEATDEVVPGYWYVSGTFVPGDLCISVSPRRTTIGEVVTVTVTLPPKSNDAEVVFQLTGGQPGKEPVVGGLASHAYVFAQPGIYRVAVSSAQHAPKTVRVIVE